VTDLSRLKLSTLHLVHFVESFCKVRWKVFGEAHDRRNIFGRVCAGECAVFE